MAEPHSLESRLEAYDYVLPERLIAQQAAVPRDSSRLFVVDRARASFSHHHFSELPDFLDRQDLLIANNTRVLKARLLGNRLSVPGEAGGGAAAGGLGGKVEFVLLEELRPRVWEGLFHASARHKAGLRFQVPTPDGKGLTGVLIRGSTESPHGLVVAEFDRDPVESGAGELPLPHYIKPAPDLQPAPGTTSQSESGTESPYQTVYAKHPGSAAAPTAGLHFTETVMARLHERGVDWRELTLHVGLGTFRPVKEEDLSRHLMHEERYEVPEETAAAVNEAKAQPGRRVLAVGTTSVRTLESAWKDGQLQAGWGRTSIFIRPGSHQFQVVDRILTNFHLPRSTLLMLVCAFAGRELMLAAYEEAVRLEYRFYSYGDAMLIL